MNFNSSLYSLALSLLLFSCNSEEKKTPDAATKPNIVLILADDMGFSDIGSYGGEVLTPHLDALAEGGLRYTQFYNNARCCPTRASLMTGVYPHQAGMGWMTAADLGTPAYQGELNRQSVTIAEVLRSAEYESYLSGKWHLSRVRNIEAGIKDNWPVQRGFDHYFGIVDGAANYFTPDLFSENTRYKPENDDFYLTHAISDTAVGYIGKHFSSGKKDPMFMYVAYTAPHWPLHALQEDIDKYREMYSMGWDALRAQRLQRQQQLGIFSAEGELSPRDPQVPAWEALSEAEQADFAQRMAIYAAQIDAMDQGIGRIVAKLKEVGEFENTLILFLSDNGACAEYISSGPNKDLTGEGDTWESYRIHWANAGSTPYREYKHWIHEGGIATPLIAHWPKGIREDLEGSFVREPGHITDIMATVVAVTGAKYPTAFKGYEIHPMEGKSLLPHFKGNENERTPIFWEHEGNIGVRDGKWKLVAKTAQDADLNPETLELYNMEEDPTELHNLATVHPERLEDLYAAWKNWAEKVGVKIDTRGYGERARAYQRMIEGDFDNQFAGWHRLGEAVADFEIDGSSQLKGENSAKITLSQPGEVALQWPLFAAKDEQFKFSFSAKSSASLKMRVAFESDLENKQAVVLDQTIELGKTPQDFSFSTSKIPFNGRFRMAFYPLGGEAVNGSSVWVDAVKLE